MTVRRLASICTMVGQPGGGTELPAACGVARPRAGEGGGKGEPPVLWCVWGGRPQVLGPGCPQGGPGCSPVPARLFVYFCGNCAVLKGL